MTEDNGEEPSMTIAAPDDGTSREKEEDIRSQTII